MAPELERAVSAAFLSATALPVFVRAVDTLLLSRRRFENPVGDLLEAPSLSGTEMETYWSPRHLSRLFRQCAGMSAKTFLRVARINAAVRPLSSWGPYKGGGV